MDKIIWESNPKKRGDEKKREEIRKSLLGKEIDYSMKKEATIGFNANQFIVRLPRQLSDVMKLNAEDAKKKKYKLKFVWDKESSEGNTFKGGFEVVKDE